MDEVLYEIDADQAFTQVLVITESTQPGDKIAITAPRGEILAEHTRPAPDITYVGNA